MRISHGRSLIVAACATLAACQANTPQVGLVTPVVHSEWNAALLQASSEATAGRYTTADKALTDFATRYPATNEATESMFWRAVYKVDPANPGTSAHEAATLLDSYMTAPHPEHRSEGMVLRRLAASLETRSSLVVPAPPVAITPKPEDKTKDDEIVRLKDDLAKTTAELERIKRRLAAPKP